MTEPRRHHYVPQLLLRRFAVPRKTVYQTHVLDKRSSATYKANVEDVMVQRDFNAIHTASGVLSLETYITQLENIAAPVLECLVASETARFLSSGDRDVLAIFVALQFIRGTGHRAIYLDLAEQFKDLLEKQGMPVDGRQLGADPDIVKLAALREIATQIPEYAEHIRHKDMIVCKAPAGTEFIIGDNPVTLDNHRSAGAFGNLGLAVRGIEIYLPISKSLTLGMWAKNLAEELKIELAAARQKRGQVASLALLGFGAIGDAARVGLAVMDEKLGDVEQLLHEVEAGGPVISSLENVERFNSLQVAYSERFVASASGYFELAKRMLQERPDYRGGGPRGTVG